MKSFVFDWPPLSTEFDRVRRAMPFGVSRSLSDHDVQVVSASILNLNDGVDEDFMLGNNNLSEVRLPNGSLFMGDDRSEEAHYLNRGRACMSGCRPGGAEIIARAKISDITPETQHDSQAGDE